MRSGDVLVLEDRTCGAGDRSRTGRRSVWRTGLSPRHACLVVALQATGVAETPWPARLGPAIHASHPLESNQDLPGLSPDRPDQLGESGATNLIIVAYSVVSTGTQGAPVAIRNLGKIASRRIIVFRNGPKRRRAGQVSLSGPSASMTLVTSGAWKASRTGARRHGKRVAAGLHAFEPVMWTQFRHGMMRRITAGIRSVKCFFVGDC